MMLPLFAEPVGVRRRSCAGYLFIEYLLLRISKRQYWLSIYTLLLLRFPDIIRPVSFLMCTLTGWDRDPVCGNTTQQLDIRSDITVTGSTHIISLFNPFSLSICTQNIWSSVRRLSLSNDSIDIFLHHQYSQNISIQSYTECLRMTLLLLLQYRKKSRCVYLFTIHHFCHLLETHFFFSCFWLINSWGVCPVSWLAWILQRAQTDVTLVPDALNFSPHHNTERWEQVVTLRHPLRSLLLSSLSTAGWRCHRLCFGLLHWSTWLWNFLFMPSAELFVFSLSIVEWWRTHQLYLVLLSWFSWLYIFYGVGEKVRCSGVKDQMCYLVIIFSWHNRVFVSKKLTPQPLHLQE